MMFLFITLLVVQLLLSCKIDGYKCKENEEWRECSSCEGTCGDPDTIPCTLNCKPPKCQCIVEKGYRRNAEGKCIPKAQCPATNAFPKRNVLRVKRAEMHKCKANEEYTKCGGCEGTCKQKLIPCPRICKAPGCECQASNNFVRDNHGNCIKFDDCPK